MNPHLELLLSPVYTGALHPEQLADLRKSTLTDETIRVQGIRSVPPSMIQPLLGFDLRGVTSAMLLPFPDPAGGWMDHIRVKVFPPQLSKKKGGDGEATIKYMQPKGSGVRLYFPRATMARACAPGETLRLVEGEKKALALAQLGFPTVGLCGVEGWHRKAEDALIPDFDRLHLGGRAVWIYPDADVETNEMVSHAIGRLGAALALRGAIPELVHLPSEVEEAAA
jgi:uncharacterized protein DUF3854